MGAAGSARQCCCKAPAVERIALLEESEMPVEPDGPGGGALGTHESIIQFTSSVAFVAEDEGEAILDVLRLGDCSHLASCNYYTQDGSAKSGSGGKYHGTSGRIDFAVGEKTKSVTIRLINDDAWNATLAFKVILENARGAQLGKFMYACSVKIINDDPFPGNRFRSLLTSGKEFEVSGSSLMLEFMKLMLRNERIRIDTLKCVCLDQLKGLYFFVCVYLQMYLVDVVLNPHRGNAEESENESVSERRLVYSGINATAAVIGRLLKEEEEEEFTLGVFQQYIPDNKREVAIAIGCLYVAPFILLHIVDVYKCYLSIPCEIRKVLQANLMRQFLNYQENIRNHIKHSEVIMVMIRDVIEVADKGYCKVLNIIRILGKLGFALVFILNENKAAAIPLVVYPIVLGCWLYFRQQKTIDIHETMAEKQDEMVESVEYAAQHHTLISDFHMREPLCATFEDSIDEFHDTESIACAVSTNNLYAAPWLTTLFVGSGYAVSAFIVSGVSSGSLSLGAFLASINVFKEVGAEIDEIYREVMDVQLSMGALMRITHYMNCPTDLNTRMSISKARQNEGAHARAEARAAMSAKELSAGAFAVDTVKIQVHDLSFSYSPENVERPDKVLDHVNISFEQGKLYGFVGPPREGKSTLLKLLGQALYPEEGWGDIFMPPHLRVWHVSRDATILRKSSFLENILMDSKLEDVGGIDRVSRICKRLMFSSRMLDMIVSDNSAGKLEDFKKKSLEERYCSWTAWLSHTDFARLNLARVLVGNPEVMVIHKPVAYFDDRERDGIMRLLREHVDEKGIELPPDIHCSRRPRTVFFTSISILGVRTADAVFKICLKDGVHPIPKENVNDALLI